MWKTIKRWFNKTPKDQFNPETIVTAEESEEAKLKLQILKLEETLKTKENELVKLTAEKKQHVVIIQRLIRLCTTAHAIMNRKKSKKGLTKEAAAEWMDDYETLATLHFKVLTDIAVGSDQQNILKSNDKMKA